MLTFSRSRESDDIFINVAFARGYNRCFTMKRNYHLTPNTLYLPESRIYATNNNGYRLISHYDASWKIEQFQIFDSRTNMSHNAGDFLPRQYSIGILWLQAAVT